MVRLLYLMLAPPGWLDGTAGTLGGVEGRRVAGAAPRGRGRTQAEAGLGRPGRARRPGPPAPRPLRMGRLVAPDTLRRHWRLVHWRWTYPARGGRPPTDAKVAALIKQMARETRAGGTSGSRASCSPSVTGCGFHGAAGAEAAQNAARAAARPHRLAAVPSRGRDDAGVRLLTRRRRGDPAAAVCSS